MQRSSPSSDLILFIATIAAIVFVGVIFFNPPGTGTPFSPAPTIATTGAARKSLQLGAYVPPVCQQLTSIDLLIDTSGSMNFGNKLPELKKALTSFTGKLADDSLIGIQSFNSQTVELIPFSFYKDVKQQVSDVINQLTASGATYTRDGFILARDKILQAQQLYPNRQFSLIFISDGIPEETTAACTNSACTNPITGGTRCFSTTQDPRTSPSIADELKNANVRIYSIVLLDQNDQCFINELTRLMQDVASPNSYFATFNETQLTNIYSQIAQQVCNLQQ